MVQLIRRYPYWYWVVGAGITWAIILLVTWQTISPHRFHNVLIFFAGWAFGVIGASIARKIYK